MLQRIWLNSLCSSVICLIKARWLKDRAFFPDGINRKTKCKTVSVKKLKTLKKKKRVSSYRITSAIQTSVFFFQSKQVLSHTSRNQPHTDSKTSHQIQLYKQFPRSNQSKSLPRNNRRDAHNLHTFKQLPKHPSTRKSLL